MEKPACSDLPPPELRCAVTSTPEHLRDGKVTLMPEHLQMAEHDFEQLRIQGTSAQLAEPRKCFQERGAHSEAPGAQFLGTVMHPELRSGVQSMFLEMSRFLEE